MSSTLAEVDIVAREVELASKVFEQARKAYEEVREWHSSYKTVEVAYRDAHKRLLEVSKTHYEKDTHVNDFTSGLK